MKYLLLIIATLSNIDWIFLDEQRQITIWVYQVSKKKLLSRLIKMKNISLNLRILKNCNSKTSQPEIIIS